MFFFFQQSVLFWQTGSCFLFTPSLPLEAANCVSEICLNSRQECHPSKEHHESITMRMQGLWQKSMRNVAGRDTRWNRYFPSVRVFKTGNELLSCQIWLAKTASESACYETLTEKLALSKMATDLRNTMTSI